MTATLAQALNRPLRVGTKTVANRLVLAPMAQITHVAFRELLAGFGGCGLLFSEMCAAKSVPHGDGRNPLGFMWRPAELPTLVCQIFGNEPAVMAAAAERIEREGFFGADINFGCCVSAVCRQTCGAALLKYPPLAAGIVAAVRRAVRFPLWVKFRTGWRDDPQAAVDMARRFEDAGADALTFHPRVAPNVRARRPKWAYIEKVKAAVAIPVFGNGDVFDARDCERMLRTTGCDGVALGRLAIARPWVFAAWTRGLLSGPHIYRDTALTLAGSAAHVFRRGHRPSPVQSVRRLFRRQLPLRTHAVAQPSPDPRYGGGRNVAGPVFRHPAGGFHPPQSRAAALVSCQASTEGCCLFFSRH